MATIKISSKEGIEELQAILTLRLGKKFTQQEIIDLCVEIAQENLEELISRADIAPKLTPELAKEILSKLENLPDTPYDEALSYANDIDKDIYSI